MMPVAFCILYASASPKNVIKEFGLLWWFAFLVAFVSLVGMCSVWTYCWDGARILKVRYAQLSVVTFLAFLVAVAIKFNEFFLFGWLFAGWFGLFLLLSFALPLMAMPILLWYSRRYILDSANKPLQPIAPKDGAPAER